MKSSNSNSISNSLVVESLGENVRIRRANIRRARAIKEKRIRTRRLVKSLVNRILQILILAIAIAVVWNEYTNLAISAEDRVGELVILPIIWIICIVYNVDLIQALVDLKDEFIRSMDEDYGINLRRK